MVAIQDIAPLAEAVREEIWTPRRQDIIWIDCNPQVGQEMRDVHPFLVLSPWAFNAKTSLVIGLPMTTAAYNADNPFAVAVGFVGQGKDRKTSYVLCHQPKSFDWRLRKAKPHPLGKLHNPLFQTVCRRLNQIIQLIV
ncbi:type II toxin-antitoxin system PemK/MazF family toxin [Desulfonatronum thioautotrophicum]|uniref:type II toxin-antitoxin system PemK/MazF family toxin n=1 Tax=Desulfonatronum thioautotrophicum TaxID=617001 RepID=UPI000AB16094|nr:type II toxin-antitoxin system PemK/MazF family toxin [Desulfonatronum thioautotrophicum]